jgi:cephalosporin hydroxylase
MTPFFAAIQMFMQGKLTTLPPAMESGITWFGSKTAALTNLRKKMYSNERRREMLITSDLERKAKAAYEHGRMDFLAGAPCDPKTPLGVYRDLNEDQRIYVMESWMNGWTDESMMQSLPEGLPA